MALYEVVTKGTIQSQQHVTVRTYRSLAPTPDPAEFVEQYGGLLRSKWILAAHDQLEMNEITVRLLDVPSPGISYVPPNWPWAGEYDGVPLASYQVAVFQLRGVNPAYPFRGSIRLGGLSEAQVDGNVIESLSRPLWQDVADVFKSSFGDGTGFAWVPVLSTKTYPTPNPIASATLNPLLGTQNSRKVGRGA